MKTAYRITPEVMGKFKEPFGTLIEGTSKETAERLRDSIKKENPPMLITVGDTVSYNLHQTGIVPQLSIIDNLAMRKKIYTPVFPDKVIIRTQNPQGFITDDAISAIQKGLQSSKATQIVVDGEEDLLTLIVVLYAPENSLVVYGQPDKGVVVVKVTAKKRAEAEAIFKRMQRVE